MILMVYLRRRRIRRSSGRCIRISVGELKGLDWMSRWVEGGEGRGIQGGKDLGLGVGAVFFALQGLFVFEIRICL